MIWSGLGLISVGPNTRPRLWKDILLYCEFLSTLDEKERKIEKQSKRWEWRACKEHESSREEEKKRDKWLGRKKHNKEREDVYMQMEDSKMNKERL